MSRSYRRSTSNDCPASAHREKLEVGEGFTPVSDEQFDENEDEGLFAYVDHYHDVDTGNVILNEFRGGKPKESRIVSDTVCKLSEMR